MSTWYFNQLQHRSIQNCFKIGWNICIRSEILSYWLSNKLSYKSTIERKIEVLDFRRPQIMAPERQFSDRCVGPPGGLKLNPYLKNKHCFFGSPCTITFFAPVAAEAQCTYIHYVSTILCIFNRAYLHNNKTRPEHQETQLYNGLFIIVSPFVPACLLDCTDSRFLNNLRHDSNTKAKNFFFACEHNFVQVSWFTMFGLSLYSKMKLLKNNLHL